MPEDATNLEGALALASAAGGGGRDGEPPAPKLDSASQAHIGQGLRAMYDDLLLEPIPAHFLARLESAADPEQSS